MENDEPFFRIVELGPTYIGIFSEKLTTIITRVYRESMQKRLELCSTAENHTAMQQSVCFGANYDVIPTTLLQNKSFISEQPDSQAAFLGFSINIGHASHINL